PTDAAANSIITPAVVVTALDQFGNTVTTFSGSVTVSITPLTGNPLGQLQGTLTQSAVGGSATFSDLSITVDNTLLPPYRLTAQAAALSDAISHTFNIAPCGPLPRSLAATLSTPPCRRTSASSSGS